MSAAGRDLAPFAATRRQWRDRHRRQALTVAGRVAAPLVVLTVLNAAWASSRRGLWHRLGVSVRPALVIVVVGVPLGVVVLLLVALLVRRRDRRRPLAAGELFVGRAILHGEPDSSARVRYLDARPSPRWNARNGSAGGALRLVHDRRPGDGGLLWMPSESSRSRGFQPFWIRAGDMAGAEADIGPSRRGDIRITLMPEGHIDFGVLDMARFVGAFCGSTVLPAHRPNGGNGG